MADSVTQLRSRMPSREVSIATPAQTPVRQDTGSSFLPELPSFARRIFGFAPVRAETPAMPAPLQYAALQPAQAPSPATRSGVPSLATDPRVLDMPVQGPPMPPAAPPAPPPNMQRGETSERVRDLQALLRDVGLLGDPPDGSFGRTTERAILDFQSQYTGPDGAQLPVSGVADPMTLRALRDYKKFLAEQQRSPSPQLPDDLVKVDPNYEGIGSVQVLRPGARGAEVTRAQNLLRALGYDVQVTNTFDEPTRAAVADFQALYTLAMGTDLEPDGVLGPNTGNAMASAARRTRESPQTFVEYARRYREQLQQQPQPNPGPGPQPRPPTGPVIRAGSTSRAAVIELQNSLRALNYAIEPDGDFGPATTAALTDFQRLYTLFTGTVIVADGALNDATRVAIMTALTSSMMQRLPEPMRAGRVDVGYTRGTPTHIVTRNAGDGTDARLETRAALSYYAMRQTAMEAGGQFQAGSSFRTMQNQRDIARRYRNQPGRAATPGYSTHQTGIAIDTEGVNGAGDTWLRANGRRFGFVLPGYRYTNSDGHSAVEHWHWEYRVDRLPNAARRFYGLPELAQDPTPTAPPAAPRRTARRNSGSRNRSNRRRR